MMGHGASRVGFWLVLGLAVLLGSPVGALGQYVESPFDPYITHVGAVTTQGDAVMNADSARSTFGVDGAGVKIGVISNAFNGYGGAPSVATQIANGDLPGVGNPNGYLTGVTIVKDDLSATFYDEGRAMLEIVHDDAPGAALYFHSAFNNPGAEPSICFRFSSSSLTAILSA